MYSNNKTKNKNVNRILRSEVKLQKLFWTAENLTA